MAVISPATKPVEQPDYLARLKRNFGEKVLSVSVTEGRGEVSLNIRTLAPGIYFVQTATSRSSWINRFVKSASAN